MYGASMGFILGVCILILIDNGFSSPVIIQEEESTPLQEKKSEFLTVHQQTQISRRRRDAVDHVIFPPTMEFDLEFREQPIKLRLKRHEYITPDVHLRDEIGQIKHDLARKTGVYYDTDNHGSFVVQCEDSRVHCNLRGSMVLDGDMWDIAPEGESSTLHRAVQSNANTNIKFGTESPTLPDIAGSMASEIGTEEVGREKRAIPTQCQIVECLAIMDESIWEFYLNQTGMNATAAEEAIAAYYLALYIQADLIFNSINVRNDTCMRLYLAGVIIQKNITLSWSYPNELSFPGADLAYVEAVEGMNLCGANGNAVSINTNLSVDLTQCFTRKDIVWNENSRRPSYLRFYRSLGYRGMCCDTTFNVYQGSVIESYGDMVEVLIAHEIARALSARDDKDSGCLDQDGYIMSSEVTIDKDKLKNKNQWYFSTCSVNQMYKYIATKPSCLSTHGFNVTQFDNFNNQPLPGTSFNLTSQCEVRFGLRSTFCDPTGQNRTFYDDMCGSGMYCTEVEFGSGGCTGITRPFDGSPCGTFGSFCSIGVCIIRKGLGENCTCHTDCSASNATCSYANNTCVCADGYYDDDGATIGGSCVEKVAVGQTCPQPDACLDPNAVCDNGTCTCVSGYYTENGACFLLKCLGESCNASLECLGNDTECSGSPSTCRCPSDRYFNVSSGNCDLKKDLGSSCEDGQCGPIHSVCGSVTNVCECQEGFFDTDGAATAGGNCTAKLAPEVSCTQSDSCMFFSSPRAQSTQELALGVSCTQSDSCADPNANCTGTCQCPSDFFNNNGTCERKKCIGEPCTNVSACLSINAECSGWPSICQCPSGFYLNDTTANCDTKKDLGSSCEDGECGPTNSVCSSSSRVCECQEGFFDSDGAAMAGGNCTAKLALGVPCTQSDSCADPIANCTQTCQCPSDYFNNAGTCERKKCIGEPCSNVSACLSVNAECSGWPSICQCPSGFYLNDTTANCDIKKDLGSSCEDGQCGPTNSVCSSSSRVCECQEGFFDTDGAGMAGGNCTAKLALGVICTQSDSCADPNANCSGTCQCLSDFFNNNGTCERKKCVGEPCTNVSACLSVNAECSGWPSICQCPSGFYLNDTTANCDTKKDLGSSCEDGQCGPTNSVCSSSSRVCECQEGFFDTDGAGMAGGNCTAKLALGVSCTQSDSCADPNANCSGTCQCPSDFFNNAGTCERKKCIGEPCTNVSACLSVNAECSGWPSICQCPSGFYLNDTTANCDTKKDLGSSCEDGECGPTNSVCSSSSRVCDCQEGFFDTDGAAMAGGNCTGKLALGVSCTQSDSCADPNANCSGTCQCPSDFFNNAGTCERKKCIGEPCTNVSACLSENAECSGWPSICQCPSGFYLNDTTANCDTKKDLGSSCVDGECGPTNSVCSSSSRVCECQEGFFDTDGAAMSGGNCTAKLALGVSCTQSDSCADPIANCSGTCQCPSDYFNNNGTCERKKCIGESCTNSSECQGVGFDCIGTPLTCQCPNTSYVSVITGNCEIKKALNESCGAGQCDDVNSVCHPQLGVCRCAAGYQPNNVTNVCERGCPTGEFERFIGSCYLFGTAELFYQAARTYCDSFDSDLYASGLVQVDSVEELQFLKNFMLNRTLQPDNGYWNDLFQTSTNGNETWRTSGDPLVVSDWSDGGDPNDLGGVQSCTTFWKSFDYKQADIECTNTVNSDTDRRTSFALCEIIL